MHELLLVRANVVPISPILFTLIMEALSSSETSVLTRGTRRNIPKDVTLLNSCDLLTIIHVCYSKSIYYLLLPLR
jgi:hypothetical protein